ncbi:hypothetical protein L9F63_014852, partial [Diploptera punctata]
RSSMFCYKFTFAMIVVRFPQMLFRVSNTCNLRLNKFIILKLPEDFLRHPLVVKSEPITSFIILRNLKYIVIKMLTFNYIALMLYTP